MSPKTKRAAQTSQEQEAETRRSSLRKKAQSTVLSVKPPASEHRIPKALQHCDNADITKRNTSRKKKYLFLFPGALQVPPGAQIGQLDDLNTATPTLSIEVHGGKIVLSGTLVLPNNALFTLKAGSRRREVKVVDTLDTIVAFSEWKFVTADASHPCAIPSALICNTEGGLWKTKPTTRTARKRADDHVESSEDEGGTKLSQTPARINPTRNARAKRSLCADEDSDEYVEDGQLVEQMNAATKVIDHINLIDDENEVVQEPKSLAHESVVANQTKQWTQMTLTTGRTTSNRDTSRAARARLKRRVVESEDEDENVTVNDTKVIGERSSARKRKKVFYTQSDDEYDDDVADADDDDGDYGFNSNDDE